MSFHPNDWNAIRAFYREAEPDILRAGRNEWGMDPYLWDEIGMIFMTPIEFWLWHDIRNCDAVLYPQYPVGRYFVDFGNPVAKVAVECDGAAYHTDKAKDEARDAELARIGWTVYRAPGWLCKTDTNPETGEAGDAYKFMQRICEEHGISRFSRTTQEERDSEDDGWRRIGEVPKEAILQVLERHFAIKMAALRAKLGRQE